MLEQLPGHRLVTVDGVGRPASYSTAGTVPWKEAVREAITDRRREAGMPSSRFAVSLYFGSPTFRDTDDVLDLDNLIKPTLGAMEGVFGLRPWTGLGGRLTTAWTA